VIAVSFSILLANLNNIDCNEVCQVDVATKSKSAAWAVSVAEMSFWDLLAMLCEERASSPANLPDVEVIESGKIDCSKYIKDCIIPDVKKDVLYKKDNSDHAYINVSSKLNILLDEQIKLLTFSQGTAAIEDKTGSSDSLPDPRNDIQGLLFEAESLLEAVKSSDNSNNMDENSAFAKKDGRIEFRSCLLDYRLEADKSVTDVSRKNENDSLFINPKTNEFASKLPVVEAKNILDVGQKSRISSNDVLGNLNNLDGKATEKMTELDGAKKVHIVERLKGSSNVPEVLKEFHEETSNFLLQNPPVKLLSLNDDYVVVESPSLGVLYQMNFAESNGVKLEGALNAIITLMSYEGKEAARIAVHPPELGHIDVDIDILQSGGLRANFNVEGQNVANLLMGQLDSLRQSLNANGFQVLGLNVYVKGEGDDLGGQRNKTNHNEKKIRVGESIVSNDEIGETAFILDIERGLLQWIA